MDDICIRRGMFKKEKLIISSILFFLSIMKPSSKVILRDWLFKCDFDFFITMNFNKASISLNSTRSIIKKWYLKVIKNLYGSNYKPSSYKFKQQQPMFFGFVEHIDYNTHYHFKMTIPDKHLHSKFMDSGQELLKKIISSATLRIDYVSGNNNSKTDDKRTTNYSIKDTWMSRNYGEFLISATAPKWVV